jgi:hypothetical protein
MRLSFKTTWPWNNEKTNFVEKITRQPGFRPKIHTLREDPNERWKPGRKIDMTIGDRYHPMVFNSMVCKSTQSVHIYYDNFLFPMVPEVYIDGRELLSSEVFELAKNDGFDSLENFYRWFDQSKKLKLIHWTDFKY